MIYNVLIGRAAGQGMETLATILEKLFKKKGFEIFTLQDYMFRVRWGHNFFQIRFGDEEISSHCYNIDGIIALNKETFKAEVAVQNITAFEAGYKEVSPKYDIPSNKKDQRL